MHTTFKPVDTSQRSLVVSWLQQPHVAKWFYGKGLENTIRGLDAFLKGTPFFNYWLVFDQKHPFSLLITSRVDKERDVLAKWCSPDAETITLDMFIGDGNYLGKGYAALVIQEFLPKQFPDVDEVLTDPEASNSRAIHVYKKAGFVILGEFIPSHSPNVHYMMRLNMHQLRKK